MNRSRHKSQNHVAPSNKIEHSSLCLNTLYFVTEMIDIDFVMVSSPADVLPFSSDFDAIRSPKLNARCHVSALDIIMHCGLNVHKPIAGVASMYILPRRQLALQQVDKETGCTSVHDAVD